ncbi:MAG: hypothetical protein K2P33_09670 [Acutalibacter sp.]|nr:hypothetical protein [Acutalibacter sp.]
MTKEELRQAFQLWCGCAPLPPSAKLPAVPIAELDVSENSSQLVSHLYFLVPDVSSGSPRYFFFFEENTFVKDAMGDLSLIHSTIHPLTT